MRRFALLCCVAVLALGSMSAAHAVLLDFEGLTYTPVTGGGDIVPVAASVLDDDYMADGVLFGRAGVSTGVAVIRDWTAPSSGLNSVAGLNASGILPGSTAGGAVVGDIYLSFVSPGTYTPSVTDSVQFTIGDGGGDLDSFSITAYDLSDQIVYSNTHFGTSRFAVAIAAPDIHRVTVDFLGDYGYSMDDLQFNTPGPGPEVPEPATLFLMASGLVALVGVRRRAGKR
jgi:hypothetical protein